MKTLKEKLDNYSSDDFGHNTTPELDEVIDKVGVDVKEAVLDIYKLEEYYNCSQNTDFDNQCIKYFKEKYNINIMDLDSIDIHKKIFGDFEK